jgi:hypothetical protein
VEVGESATSKGLTGDASDAPAWIRFVVGMVSNSLTTADPNDAVMLDVVGLDTAALDFVLTGSRVELRGKSESPLTVDSTTSGAGRAARLVAR